MNEMKLMHKLIEIFKYKESYQQSTSTLQPQDMYILERIYFREKIRFMDIAKEYHVAPSTLTGIIDRLDKKEYIQRLRNDEDRRAVEIVITDKGKEMVKQHVAEDQLFVSKFFGVLDEATKRTLIQILEKIVTELDKDKVFMEGERYDGTNISNNKD